MRPTTPAAAAVVVQPDPKPTAVVEPAHDWRSLALELLKVVELRPALQPDMLAVVNKLRTAAGMTPRPDATVVQDQTPAPTSIEAPAAPEGAVRCVNDVYYNEVGDELYPDGSIVPDFLGTDLAPAKADSTSSPLPRDPDAEWHDDWLDPFATARREAADPEHRARVQAHLEAERERTDALKKSLRPRPPMRKS